MLVALTLLTACEGRCRATDALADEVPGGLCGTTFADGQGLCIRGDEVFTCSIEGLTWHEASCARIGRIVPEGK
jgi:hypothetical protein